MPCPLCNNDDGACIERALIFDGDSGEVGGRVVTVPVPYGEEPMYDGWVPTAPCAGCGVAEDYHHGGCAFEVCPRCEQQLVECPCRPGVVDRGDRGFEAD